MRLLHILPMLLLCPILSIANTITEDDRQAFINRFIDISVEEMERTGIPASITLAQAIVESGWGQSRIAVEGNNFFCIKCNNGWEGPGLQEWDDDPEKSCFRKYDNVVQSFFDHSDFLVENIRYQPLFQLDKLDYKAWAKGLKDCGYATHPQYDEKLVEVIEGYSLWIYDHAIPGSRLNVLDTEEIEAEEELETEPFQFAVSDEPANPVSAPAVMEVPGYRKETIPQHRELNRPLKITNNNEIELTPRSRKIRPIMPMPNIDLERR